MRAYFAILAILSIVAPAVASAGRQAACGGAASARGRFLDAGCMRPMAPLPILYVSTPWGRHVGYFLRNRTAAGLEGPLRFG